MISGYHVLMARIFGHIITVFTMVVIVGLGVALGFSLAETINVQSQENFREFTPALPTKILDVNGIVVTEFSADEKRELVTLSELPRHLIDAVLAREDPKFYSHRGYSIRGIGRAVYGQLTGQNLGGGSTITQQVAGTLYTNRAEKTVSRKIRELWWAIQMERRYTKNEIMEIYLNYMYMGPGVYGVEAASKYFFGHSARELTLAESALLVIQLSSPARYNPLDNPNVARGRQEAVLNRMIMFGSTTREEADFSMHEYWDNYDYTRASVAAYYQRDDAAPWFSEYVRRELDSLMYGTMDYYRDGYTVYTTLDLNHQNAAERFMQQGLARANREFAAANSNTRLMQTEDQIIPIINLLSLCFDMNGLNETTARNPTEQRAVNRYIKTLNPAVDMAAAIFGIPELKIITGTAFNDMAKIAQQNIVEGALICIENDTGRITAIIGGSKFDSTNQLIRATQAKIMPGSAFKPLYYSAAIDSRLFTATTLLYDVPIVFHTEDGKPYLPINYSGGWKGPLLLYEALATSLNIPALQILDTIGFDAAINRSAALLGITDPAAIRKTFPRVYPLGLGISSVSPLQMARAFAIFANQGREVTPFAIRSVEDRTGRVVLDLERDIREEKLRNGSQQQVISPQNAYIMTNLLKKTIDIGTLASGSGYGSKLVFSDADGKKFRMPAAGKTGTTQDWADAWAVGYTAYYTIAVWFGFDKPGNTLGTHLSGAALSGPVWGDLIREIHQNLPFRDFVRPTSGIIDVTVCAKSGLLKTSACNQGEVTMPFLEGTQPQQYCTIHSASPALIAESRIQPMRTDALALESDSLVYGLTMPTLPAILTGISAPAEVEDDFYDFSFPAYNPLLD
ncbi:penicillin-binding protein [Spirochaetia bacterium]|nr:penicillin-binding protein [Spirochaetia bacterium]GHU29337.1 penicillin-binding protein [Spirochaetia bacterium]